MGSDCVSDGQWTVVPAERDHPFHLNPHLRREALAPHVIALGKLSCKCLILPDPTCRISPLSPRGPCCPCLVVLTVSDNNWFRVDTSYSMR